MIRLSREMGDRIFIALLRVFDDGRTIRSDQQSMYEYWYGERKRRQLEGASPELLATVRTVLERWSGEEEPSYIAIREQLQSQILSGGSGASSAKGDVDLIDYVVEALQLQHGRNVMSGKTLDGLRRHVLLPQERAALFSRLGRDAACGGCGHQFTEGEQATFDGGDADGRTQSSFYCQQCVVARSIRCAACDGHVELPKKVHQITSRLVCQECQKGKGEEPSIAPVVGPEMVVGGSRIVGASVPTGENALYRMFATATATSVPPSFPTRHRPLSRREVETAYDRTRGLRNQVWTDEALPAPSSYVVWDGVGAGLTQAVSGGQTNTQVEPEEDE